MPASTDTGPFDTPTDLIDLIRREPDTVEPGLRLMEIDLHAGEARHVDLVGTDRHGVLTLLAVAARSPDETLLRLLDGYRWAIAEYPLLRRVCSLDHREDDSPAGHGMRPNARLLLLAPGFSHRFMERLPLLTVRVTPLLARRVSLGGDDRLLVEPAAALFGLESPVASGREERSPSGESPPLEFQSADRAIDRFLRDDTPVEEAERGGRGNRDEPPPIDVPFESMLTPADRALFTETLSTEELEEFERFEHQRRRADGGQE